MPPDSPTRLADELCDVMIAMRTQYPSKPRRIYVAGALSGAQPGDRPNRSPSKVVTDYISNVNIMCTVAGMLRRRGYFPYVPGADLILGMIDGGWDESMYRDMTMAFLEVCDAVLVISHSSGVERELERARSLGIPIYYSIDELEAA